MLAESRTALYNCIPYVGITLSEILFTEEGNPDTIEVDTAAGKQKHVNFLKFRRFVPECICFGSPRYARIAKVLEELRQYQHARFPNTKCENILNAHLDIAQVNDFLMHYRGYDEVAPRQSPALLSCAGGGLEPIRAPRAVPQLRAGAQEDQARQGLHAMLPAPQLTHP